MLFPWTRRKVHEIPQSTANLSAVTQPEMPNLFSFWAINCHRSMPYLDPFCIPLPMHVIIENYLSRGRPGAWSKGSLSSGGNDLTSLLPLFWRSDLIFFEIFIGVFRVPCNELCLNECFFCLLLRLSLSEASWSRIFRRLFTESIRSPLSDVSLQRASEVRFPTGNQ